MYNNINVLELMSILFLSFSFYIRCVIVWSEAKDLIMLTVVAAEGVLPTNRDQESVAVPGRYID